jgi:hypothetical protein
MTGYTIKATIATTVAAAQTGVLSIQSRISAMIAARQAKAIASLSLHDQRALGFGVLVVESVSFC